MYIVCILTQTPKVSFKAKFLGFLSKSMCNLITTSTSIAGDAVVQIVDIKRNAYQSTNHCC